jgi:hypothetical protein
MYQILNYCLLLLFNRKQKWRKYGDIIYGHILEDNVAW